MHFEAVCLDEDSPHVNLRFDACNKRHLKKDKHLEENMNLSAVLLWLVRGAMMYLESGLGVTPECCKRELMQLVKDSDVLGSFIKAQLVVGEGNYVLAREFDNRYNSYRQLKRLKPLQSVTLKSDMKARGHEHFKCKHSDEFRDRRVYSFIRWRNADEDVVESDEDEG